MFADRYEAGRELAEQLKHRVLRNPLVLAIPRGGVAVGSTLAEELNAELDVVLVTKLRSAHHPEFALGAVAEGGDVYLDTELLSSFGLGEDDIDGERHFQAQKLAFRRVLFQTARPIADPCGRSVIITDDGISTGATMLAAVHCLRSCQPHELIVAVPVASPAGLSRLGLWCDEVICLQTPAMFFSVGQFFKQFARVRDIEAVRLIRKAYQCRATVSAT